MTIGLMTLQAHAQTLSPLTEDQDGDGNPINEEEDISLSCYNDFKLNQSHQQLGMVMNMTFNLSAQDCDFVMHYLSGQCEKENVEDVCNYTLSDYLTEKGLLRNTDYPTDSSRFNALLEEREQKRILNEQQIARDEREGDPNTPDWAENLGDRSSE